MSAAEKIQTGTEIAMKYGENVEIQRQNQPTKVEPTYYRAQLEQEGRSGWSGGWAGGRTR
ncbi:hypothetical protein [Acidicapsa acidisoli]|uniref:hypothetical protein n=1 Tax=Acidicapsa acidisoli TaxID=1615681 RepID=UPI0021E08705|nr:hypothetical protein [Acidicapsa acidisoli]